MLAALVAGVSGMTTYGLRAAQSEKRLQQELYRSDVNSAYSAWLDHDLATSRRLLERHRPKPGQVDLREFAWHHLWGRHKRIDDQFSLRHDGFVSQVAFSPDGCTIATFSNRSVRFWNVEKCEVIYQFQLNQEFCIVTAIALSPDWQEMVACGETQHGGRLLRWRVGAGKSLETLLELPDALLDVTYSADGRLLAIEAKNETVGIFNLATRQWIDLSVAHEEVDSAGFSPDGRMFVASGRCLRIRDVGTREIVREFRLSPGPGRSFVFAPDGQSLAYDRSRDLVTTIDIQTGQPRTEFERYRIWDFQRLTISPDGNVLATICAENTVWDCETGGEVDAFAVDGGIVFNLAFSSDGKCLALSAQRGIVTLYDLSRRRIGGTFPAGFSAGPLAISPDGKTVAAGTRKEGIRLHDALTGAQLGAIPHPHRASALSFARGGQTLIAGCGNREVWTWMIDQAAKSAAGENPIVLRLGRDLLSVASP